VHRDAGEISGGTDHLRAIRREGARGLDPDSACNARDQDSLPKLALRNADLRANRWTTSSAVQGVSHYPRCFRIHTVSVADTFG
jgi:hypothetical protein